MMSANVAAVLEPVGAGRVVLESVDVSARLRGLLSETEVVQTYRNLEDVNIEAVYTFPLPLDAVLLDLELTLNGRTLRGLVQAKAQAEAHYENAIDDGDAAVLLQAAGAGAFTLNVGNLLPRETAVVRFRYAQLHRWQGDSLRFQLPTTIAPRYGDPSAAGLAPHQIPETVLTSDHGFSLTVALEGAHATADVECPTHTVAVQAAQNGREIRLNGGSALMDRDFVLVLRESAGTTEGLWSRDGDEIVTLASFHPRFPSDLTRARRHITLVVDCSGSMGGDSIAQAKTALHEILALLEPGDRFNLIAFGSTQRALFPEPVHVDAGRVRAAARFIDKLNADMGGTEIGAALDAAYRGGSSDVLLMTDGEVWNADAIVERARASRSRLFTVGVGSAVAEAFVRSLAEETGGACELVSPREDMAERIVRHFCRMDQPRAAGVRVEWPANAQCQVPKALQTVYGGDTVHVLAWLAKAPTDHATLTLTLQDGREIREQVAFSATKTDDADALPRVAVHRRLRGLSTEEATELAVRYQLVTEQTSCALVHERDAGEKADKIPALRKVPQMLAAGLGGAGSVAYEEMDRPALYRRSSVSMAACVDFAVDSDESASQQDTDLEYLDIPAFLRGQAVPKEESESRLKMRSTPDAEKLPSSGEIMPPSGDDLEYLEIPAFLRRQADQGKEKEVQAKRRPTPSTNLDRIVAALSARFPDSRAVELDINTLEDLAAIGMEPEVLTRLADLIDGGEPEDAVVLAVLSVVASSSAGKHLSRNAQRLIRRASRDPCPNRGLLKYVTICIFGGG